MRYRARAGPALRSWSRAFRLLDLAGHRHRVIVRKPDVVANLEVGDPLAAEIPHFLLGQRLASPVGTWRRRAGIVGKTPAPGNRGWRDYLVQQYAESSTRLRGSLNGSSPLSSLWILPHRHRGRSPVVCGPKNAGRSGRHLMSSGGGSTLL